MRSLLIRLFYMLVRFAVDNQVSRSLLTTTFPAARGRNYLVEPLFPKGKNEGFFTKFYTENTTNPLGVNYSRFKLEIVEGKLFEGGKPHRFEIKEPSALPYSVTNVDFFNARRDDYSTQFRLNEQKYNFRRLIAERLYYLPLKSTGTAEFLSDHDLVIGKPIPLSQAKPNRHKLVLMIFIDSFTNEVMNHISPEKDIPNIHRFFSKGMVFENCHSSSNWTVPGVATIVSGKSIRGHGMFHPRKDLVLGDGYPTMSELFQKNGHLTFQACGNWRKSPAAGYAKGFDRTIFKIGLSIGDAINASLDHLRAFPERDNFCWLSIFDLHHHIQLTPEVATQLNAPLEAHDYYIPDGKSPFLLDFLESRKLRYLEELKRIDLLFGNLLSYIENTYNDDEILVAACSDHGTTYFSEDTKSLCRERCNVAFMLRGGGVPAGRSDELVQNSDILPAVLSIAGIDKNVHFEGRVPEVLGGPPARSHVMTEIMYPGSPYEATIRDNEFDFYLRSKNPVDDDGHIDLGEYEVSLFLRKDFAKEVTEEHPEKVKLFVKTILDALSIKN